MSQLAALQEQLALIQQIRDANQMRSPPERIHCSAATQKADEATTDLNRHFGPGDAAAHLSMHEMDELRAAIREACAAVRDLNEDIKRGPPDELSQDLMGGAMGVADELEHHSARLFDQPSDGVPISRTTSAVPDAPDCDIGELHKVLDILRTIKSNVEEAELMRRNERRTQEEQDVEKYFFEGCIGAVNNGIQTFEEAISTNNAQKLTAKDLEHLLKTLLETLDEVNALREAMKEANVDPLTQQILDVTNDNAQAAQGTLRNEVTRHQQREEQYQARVMALFARIHDEDFELAMAIMQGKGEEYVANKDKQEREQMNNELTRNDSNIVRRMMEEEERQIAAERKRKTDQAAADAAYANSMAGERDRTRASAQKRKSDQAEADRAYAATVANDQVGGGAQAPQPYPAWNNGPTKKQLEHMSEEERFNAAIAASMADSGAQAHSTFRQPPPPNHPPPPTNPNAYPSSAPQRDQRIAALDQELANDYNQQAGPEYYSLSYNNQPAQPPPPSRPPPTQPPPPPRPPPAATGQAGYGNPYGNPYGTGAYNQQNAAQPSYAGYGQIPHPGRSGFG